MPGHDVFSLFLEDRQPWRLLVSVLPGGQGNSEIVPRLFGVDGSYSAHCAPGFLNVLPVHHCPLSLKLCPEKLASLSCESSFTPYRRRPAVPIGFGGCAVSLETGDI